MVGVVVGGCGSYKRRRRRSRVIGVLLVVV